MAFSDPIDIYCERLGPAFWAEPANALTNAAFLVAAAAAWMLATPDAKRDPLVRTLIAVLALIGFGSFAFHTLATRGAVLLDVIPIAIFIHLYFYAGLRRFLSLPVLTSIVATIVFFVAGLAIGQAGQGKLNGSISYAPAVIGLLIMAAATYFSSSAAAKHARAVPRLLGIGFVFLVSLTFRTIDDAVCSAWPLGTHFLWHVLNALVLYLLVRLLCDTTDAARA
ncbi:MAG: hypothetical protein A4S14_17395 [Proteobacteria bacterium SG_bin9]|nr:MAG: hypothetical protein A4S14_17395 [Proteobacteria bacterium SG_bin9]